MATTTVTMEKLESLRDWLLAEADRHLRDSLLALHLDKPDNSDKDGQLVFADGLRRAGERVARISGYIEALRDMLPVNPQLVDILLRDLDVALKAEQGNEHVEYMVREAARQARDIIKRALS